MKIVIIFNLDNEAFRLDDGSLCRPAISDTLDDIAIAVNTDQEEGIIKDINGNTVGDWKLKGEL